MTRNQAMGVVICLTLMGFALRVYNLDRLSLRGDEAHTVLTWVSHPLIETLNSDIVIRDPQPPLAFAIYRVWSLFFGNVSEFGIRLLPALMNTIGVPAMYVLAKRVTHRQTGIFAAFLWAVHPFLIWHAQDARNYAIWVVFSTLALWSALLALKQRRRIDWLIYIGFAAAAAYLYYLELFLVLALNIYVFVSYWRSRMVLRNWIISQVAVGLLLAPWYLQERLIFNDIYSGTTFPFEPIRIVTWIIPSLNFGRTVSETWMLSVWGVVLGLLVLGVVVHWRRSRGYGVLLALAGFLPPILLALVSLKMNVFTPRYILAVVPIYILLISALVIDANQLFQTTVLARAFSVLLTGAWLFVIAFSLNNLYFSNDYAKSTDWRGLTNYLREHVTSNDLVIQTAADEAFTLYFDSLTDFERIPANPLQSSQEIVSVLEAVATNYDSVWVVARTPADWPNRTIGLDWLRRNMQIVRQTRIGEAPVDLPIQQFMPWQVQPSEIEHEPLTTFQEVAHLAGIQVSNSIEPTDELVVWAYWQPVNTTEKPLKAFLHLVGPTNPATNTPLWAQDDHFPQDMHIDTTMWETTTIYRDVFNIQLTEVPPGQYTLHIGLYDPDTGNRINTASGDSYEISPLTLP